MKIPSSTGKQTRNNALMNLLGATPANSTEPGAKTDNCSVTEIEPNPDQPRKHFDSEEINALAESITASGIIQPIVVRPGGGKYQIIAGERRWIAAQAAGLTQVPVVIRDADDRSTLLMALAENLVRSNLNAVETARAYAMMVDEFGMSATEVAKHVGRSRSAVANTLRLLELPDRVLHMVEQGKISEGHGRAVLMCSDRHAQMEIADQVLKKGLSVRDTELMASEKNSHNTKQGAKREAIPSETLAAAEALCNKLGAKRVQVKSGKRGVHVQFTFENHKEFQRLHAPASPALRQVAGL